MITKLEELTRRKEMLISRSAAQREHLAQLCRQIHTPAALMKTATGTFQVFRKLTGNPRLATSVAAVLLGAFRPRLAKLALPASMAIWAVRPLQKLWARRRSFSFRRPPHQ